MRSIWSALAMFVVITGSSTVSAGDTVEPILTDDGLYTQEWFLESFLDLKEDLDEANGKRFAIM
ncbi:MAG: hypothetical protein ACR2QF_16170 [Geminicoccaceae bacterium]